MLAWTDYGNGIVAMDAAYVRPLLAAIHLICENGRVALVDTGTNDSLPQVLAGLQRLGLSVDAVDYVILTHIHLDHAGGAGAMMRAFPRAKLVVHPRGARHMVEPAKLVAGVTAVYGVEYVQRMYGEILPIPAERIVEAGEGTKLSLGDGRELLCLDTPGHARHHICIFDEKTNSIFTGDMFGLSYRELDSGDRQFLFPTTTPSQFDPLAMRQSVLRLLSLQPGAMYLTHYSRLHDVAAHGKDLLRRLDALVAIALREADTGPSRHTRIRQAMTDYLLAEARAYGCRLPEAEIVAIWEGDLELNAQGLEVWLDSQQA